ncbi:hypothetical protein HanLR1_Chr02g0059541 [Helianthus annuus]|nr:hypothetical protein HanLR1_Chr02g0059541 [Helianthus annuus]
MSRLNSQSYGTVGIGEPMGIRVLSGRSLFRSLSFLLPLCNEDTSPVTSALIISGCDRDLRRLYESRVVITRNRARRASHKLDCTGITEYVLLVIRAYALFFFVKVTY